MPSESDRPIEKQLREQAERRRASAGKDAFALHPVTRNALQVEVEREFGKLARNGGQRVGWLTWWPRLAFASGAIALLALLAVIWLPRGQHAEVGDLALVDKSGTAPAPVPEPKTASKSAVTEGIVLPASTRLKAEVQAASNGADGRRQEFLFAARNSQVVSPVAASPAIANTPSAPAIETRASSANRIRREATSTASRPTADRAMAPRALPLQHAFRVTIADDVMTILDADNSAYRGQLRLVAPESVTAAKPGRSLTFEETYYKFEQGGLVQRVPVAAQFTLTGTNRTTRQAVQIIGQMITQTQTAPSTASAPRAPGVFLQIQGTATVDGGASFPIDATTQPQ